MASITIRKLDEVTEARLRIRAARHGRSMEEEARRILQRSVAEEAAQEGNMAEAVRRRFAPFGGVELPLEPREPVREPPGFGS